MRNGVYIPVAGTSIANTVWRGTTSGSRINIDGFNNLSARARSTRNRVVLNEPLKHFQIAIPIFWTTGSSPVADAKFSGAQANMLFQVGIQYPFTESLTNIFAQTPVTFNSGMYYAEYDATKIGANIWWLYSDIITLPETIPAGVPFGRFVTGELPTAGVNVLPSQKASNFIPRFTGTLQSSSSLINIGTNGGASGSIFTPNTYTAHGTDQAGYDTFYDPCVMRAITRSSAKSIIRDGTSITQDVASSRPESGSISDARGNIFGDLGLYARGIRTLKHFDNNIGKASDKALFKKTLANWAGRRQIIPFMNPTHIISEHGFNDLGATATPPVWAATTAYARGDVVNATGTRICIVGGTSGAVAPTGTAATVVDGTVTWAYFNGTSGAMQQAGIIASNIMLIHDQYKLAAPSAKIIGSPITPSATSSDSFVTSVNQAAKSGGGGSASRRGYVNASVRALFAPYQLDAVIDANPFLEHTYPPTETSLWKVDGTTFPLTWDGEHPHGKGYLAADAAVTADLFT
jgi:hypothetical protein